MPAFDPVTLAQWTGGRWTATPVSPLTGFAIDTRAVRPGQVFVALKTDHRDGHEFLAAAHAGGAGAALAGLIGAVLAGTILGVRRIARGSWTGAVAYGEVSRKEGDV
jgi:UDP-N-acetylmuramoyl-tripeptide--D-alanyl-D-alanine ligase